MKVLISIVAVFSAPLIYGLLCVPLVGVLMTFQPDLVNDLGGTHDVMLTLQIETLQLQVLLLVGFVTRGKRVVPQPYTRLWINNVAVKWPVDMPDQNIAVAVFYHLHAEI